MCVSICTYVQALMCVNVHEHIRFLKFKRRTPLTRRNIIPGTKEMSFMKNENLRLNCHCY